MDNQKFFKCEHCGNLVGLINNAGVPMICCGEPMKELIPNTVDAAQEKHLPVVTVDGDMVTVKVGSVPHPMTEEHHIEFIYLQTEQGGQRRCLQTGTEASAVFNLAGDTLLEVFAYCNLHGLWKVAVTH
ncbi:MAG: desulfoferrodoxin family protein [Acetivibrio sp.]